MLSGEIALKNTHYYYYCQNIYFAYIIMPQIMACIHLRMETVMLTSKSTSIFLQISFISPLTAMSKIC